MSILELQERFIVLLLNGVLGNWSNINIHYEYYPWEGQVMEKYTAHMMVNGVRQDFHPSLESIDCLIAINDASSEKQERWTWVEFSIERSGKYKFDYKYGTPPLVADALKNAN